MDGAPLRHFPLAFILIIPETQSFNTVVWSPKACRQRHNWYFCCSCSQGWCITKILHLFGSCLAQIWQGAHRYFSAFQLTCLDMVDIVFGLVRAAWKKNGSSSPVYLCKDPMGVCIWCCQLCPIFAILHSNNEHTCWETSRTFCGISWESKVDHHT